MKKHVSRKFWVLWIIGSTLLLVGAFTVGYYINLYESTKPKEVNFQYDNEIQAGASQVDTGLYEWLIKDYEAQAVGKEWRKINASPFYTVEPYKLYAKHYVKGSHVEKYLYAGEEGLVLETDIYWLQFGDKKLQTYDDVRSYLSPVDSEAKAVAVVMFTGHGHIKRERGIPVGSTLRVSDGYLVNVFYSGLDLECTYEKDTIHGFIYHVNHAGKVVEVADTPRYKVGAQFCK